MVVFGQKYYDLRLYFHYNKMNDNSLIIFKSITNFVSQLNENFGKSNKSLQLYNRLIEKTTVTHEKVILKHIECFQKFCVSNRNEIISKNHNFNVEQVKYSDRVFINLKQIFNKSDRQDREVLWKHLLTISALTDPSGKAKEVLKQQKAKKTASKGKGGEEDFLSNLIDKVEKNVKPDTDNPMEAVTSMLSSGVFTELVSDMNQGLENGDLNIGRLMGSVQNMMSDLGPQGGAGGEGMPDLGGMMGQMTQMMGQMNMGVNESQTSSPEKSGNVFEMIEEADNETGSSGSGEGSS